jgi:hypothetical protein
MEHGLTVDLGASAALDVGGIAVIVTTHCGPANDPAFFAAHGIDSPGHAAAVLFAPRTTSAPPSPSAARRSSMSIARAGDNGCSTAAGHRRPWRLVGPAVGQDAISKRFLKATNLSRLTW